MREAASLMAMPGGLAHFAGIAAFAGGGLRIAAAAIPHAPDSIALEALYAASDLGLLFATIGVALAAWPWVGWPGHLGAGVLIGGIAGIVGPDAVFRGVNMYQVWLGVIALGSVVFAAALLRSGLFTVTAWAWIAAAVLGVAGTLAGSPEAAILAGVAFGFAYLAAGIRLMRRQGV